MCRQLRLWLSGVLLIFVVTAAVRVEAQTKPPPAGMTQKQYDELVKSVGESVIQILRAKGLVPAPPTAGPMAKPADVDFEVLVADKTREALREIPKVLGGYPAVWTDLADLPARLDAADAGGRGLWAYLSLLAATAAVALFAEAGVARLTLARRQAVVQNFA